MLNDRIIVTPVVDEDNEGLRKFKIAIPDEEVQEFIKFPMGTDPNSGVASSITQRLIKRVDGELFGIASYDKPYMEVGNTGVVSFYLKPDTDEEFNLVLLDRFITAVAAAHFPWIKRWKMYDNKKFDALLKRGLKK